MWETALALLQSGVEPGLDDSRFDLAIVPLHQFKWWTYLYLLAFHTVVAVIITELMGRSYGKWWLWLAVAFLLPIIGPISIFLYHLVASSAVAKARQGSLWERILATGPVSLLRAFRKEQAIAQEPVLYRLRPGSGVIQAGSRDANIEALLTKEEYEQARGHAWKMLDIAREAGDSAQIERYQEYLEVIAEKQSLSNGMDLSAGAD